LNQDQPSLDSLRALAQDCAGRLVARGEMAGVVDGACGGLISSLMTDLAGSSRWYRGGVVTYSFETKHEILGVDPDLNATHGAVSAESALAQARGVRSRLNAAWGLAETGIAGPQQGRKSSKPAGLAWVAVVGPDGIEEAREVTTGLDDRLANKLAFAQAALALLAETLGRQGDSS
jgi:PncC family amidohydrolase